MRLRRHLGATVTARDLQFGVAPALNSRHYALRYPSPHLRPNRDCWLRCRGVLQQVGDCGFGDERCPTA